MAHFLDLPPELLAIIFGFIHNPERLYALCLVNRLFNSYSTPVLYCHVSIFAWHKDSKKQIILLFQTLSRCSYIACHVQKLGRSPLGCLPLDVHCVLAEIRHFPKGLPIDSHSKLLQTCAQGIRNCVNLWSCIWTRDGSLYPAVLEALCNCPVLRELEINGNDSVYDPSVLFRFSRLRKISLIMPNTRVLGILPTWISITGETLRSLMMFCRTSTVVTDEFLSQLAPGLQGLEYLTIIGCPRVTHVGIAAVASASKSGLVGINIEGVSHAFDTSAFKTVSLRTQVFRRLRAITLTVHLGIDLTRWIRDVGDLLASMPLEAFSLYSISTSAWVPMPDEFWKDIVAKLGQTLRDLVVHRIQISLAALRVICAQCRLLEKLLIVVEECNLHDVAYSFALAKNLRLLHVNFPLLPDDPLAASVPLLMQRAATIASVCSSALVHIGCNMRVWQVERIVEVDENGEKYIRQSLAPQENPGVPEHFLVVRA